MTGSGDELKIDEYIKKVDDLKQPHQFAELLKTSLKESNTAKSVLRNTFKDMICSDIDTRNALKGIIRGVEREKTIWLLRNDSIV